MRKFDLIREIAAPIPLYIICELLGLDMKYVNQYKRWAIAWGQESSLPRKVFERSIREFYSFFTQFVEHCKSHSGNGMIYDLLLLPEEKERLTMEDVVEVAKLLLLAGTLTTTHLIGNIVRALLEHPRELELLRSNANLLQKTIEEALRYDAPAQGLGRFVRKESEFAGFHLAPKDRVVALIGSANRDETHFEEPDQFRIQRNSQAHISFGSGQHFCLGARLSRLEARIILDALLFTIPPFYPAQPMDQLEYTKAPFLRGIESFNLTWEPNRKKLWF
jgi:cytochrome P450